MLSSVLFIKIPLMLLKDSLPLSLIDALANKSSKMGSKCIIPFVYAFGFTKYKA
jgi:hypothetical protein